MVHRPPWVAEDWVWCAEVDAWLHPKIMEWLERGDPVTVEFGEVGFLMRNGQPAIRYDVNPRSETRH